MSPHCIGDALFLVDNFDFVRGLDPSPLTSRKNDIESEFSTSCFFFNSWSYLSQNNCLFFIYWWKLFNFFPKREYKESKGLFICIFWCPVTVYCFPYILFEFESVVSSWILFYNPDYVEHIETFSKPCTQESTYDILMLTTIGLKF